MKIQMNLLIATALIGHLALAADPEMQSEKDQTTGREIVILTEQESRSFFRPKTVDDIRQIASVSAPEAVDALEELASHDSRE